MRSKIFCRTSLPLHLVLPTLTYQSTTFSDSFFKDGRHPKASGFGDTWWETACGLQSLLAWVRILADADQVPEPGRITGGGTTLVFSVNDKKLATKLFRSAG